MPVSDRSSWTHTAGPAPQTPPLAGDAMADVVVIGGGFTGLTAAIRLAEAGADVAVLEAGDIAEGASGRNAGFLVPNLAKADPATLMENFDQQRGGQLAKSVAEAGDTIAEFSQRHDIECELKQSGWIQPVHAEVARDATYRRFEDYKAMGRPVAWLDAGAIKEATGCGHYVGGWIDRSGGTLHPVKFAYGLARAAQRLGAHIHSQTSATAIENDGSNWHVKTASGSLSTRQVLMCTNAMGGGLRADLTSSILPLTIHQLATEPLDAGMRSKLLADGQAMSDTANDLFTYRLDGEGRLITGGMAVWPFGDASGLGRRMIRRATKFLALDKTPRIETFWSGQAAVTTDFMPRLHRLADGLFAGFGCNARGIAMTHILAGALADLTAGRSEEQLPLPVTPVRPVPMAKLAGLAPHMWLAHGRLKDTFNRITAGSPANSRSNQTENHQGRKPC